VKVDDMTSRSALLLHALALLTGTVGLVGAAPAAAAAPVTTGSIGGTYTGATGSPIPAVAVTVEPPGGGNSERPAYQAVTDAAGRWQVPAALPGAYHVRFKVPGALRVYSYPGSLDAAHAQLVTVPASGTVTVDDQPPASGRARFTARDAVSGAKVPDFCVQDPLENGFHCTGPQWPDGYVELELMPGRHIIHGNARDTAHDDGLARVTVQTGQVTAGVLRVEPTGGEVRFVIRDAQTGAPVSGVTVHASRVDERFGDLWSYRAASDENGLVLLPGLYPHKYHLFAQPGDAVHGMQWIGTAGGTGVRDEARVVAPGPGAVETLPDVKLDRAGSISGTVTDATGAPAAATVALATLDPLWQETTPLVWTSDGRYTFSGLGPYRWPLFFLPSGNAAGDANSAAQWSGGTGDRRRATGIPVQAGATTQYDVTLRAGTVVSGNATGLPVYSAGGPVYAYHAATHDILAMSDDASGRYQVRLLPGQRVKLCFWSNWCYPNGSSIDQATEIRIGTTPLTVDFPGPQ
jgi:hypothetical protein